MPPDREKSDSEQMAVRTAEKLLKVKFERYDMKIYISMG